MKNFVKVLDEESRVFVSPKQKFPLISEDKRKVGIFDEPQIRELLQDPNLDQSLDGSERKTWRSFVTNFLGNHRSQE